MNTNEDVIFPPIRGISTYMQSGLFRMLRMLRMHYYAYLVPLDHKKYHSAISASIRTFDTIDHYGSSCVARNSWLSLGLCPTYNLDISLQMRQNISMLAYFFVARDHQATQEKRYTRQSPGTVSMAIPYNAIASVWITVSLLLLSITGMPMC